MSRVYDNWGKLVGEVLKREQFREMALAPPSRESSFTSTRSDLSSNYHDDIDAANNDPPPEIVNLQISGKPFPGRQLQVCGYSTNGTTSCNFEWVRHLKDGSFSYIDGTKQPNYLVTADDVDTFLGVVIQPWDDSRKRVGKIVQIFANENRKITCDPEMQSCIEKTYYSGHASYNLSLSSGYLDVWNPATLDIEHDGYTINCFAGSYYGGGKFSSSTLVTIPYGSPTNFSITDYRGSDPRNLKVDDSITRDTIVLSLRLFILKTSEKMKVKNYHVYR